ncbi:hypothetical protein [Gordonia sp. MP11Mi]|uniref:hypothetical protein n=1 Tax=Gordonia sp. MP11Mi TaxID=3022769 RepID=UPI003B213844
MVFLFIRLNDIAQQGASCFHTEEEVVSFLKSPELAKACTSAVAPRVHALDEGVDIADIEQFIHLGLNPEEEVSPNDYDNLGTRSTAALILALAFGYSKDDPIWGYVDQMRQDPGVRGQIERAVPLNRRR